MMSICGVYVVGKKCRRHINREDDSEEAMSQDDNSDMDATWMPPETDTDSSGTSIEPGLC